MNNNALETTPTTLVGAAGEYYVLTRLCLRGYIAALAPKGVPNADIVVTDVNGTRLFAVQVKARIGKGADKGWHMQAKHETLIAPLLFYCFVDFTDQAAPVTYVVPSRVVAEVITKTHHTWLVRPGKNGRAHQDSNVRRFCPNYRDLPELPEYGVGWLEPYREAWHLLSTGKEKQ